MPRLTDAALRKAGTIVGSVWARNEGSTVTCKWDRAGIVRTEQIDHRTTKVTIYSIDWYGDYAYIRTRIVGKTYKVGQSDEPMSVESFQAKHTLLKGEHDNSSVLEKRAQIDEQAKVRSVGWTV